MANLLNNQADTKQHSYAGLSLQLYAGTDTLSGTVLPYCLVCSEQL